MIRKLLISMIVLFILLSALSSANNDNNSTQLLTVNQETLKVDLLLNSCENTTTVFRIERLNYSSTSDTLELNYTFVQITNSTRTKNITKIINKYTTTKTGEYIVSNYTSTIIKIIVPEKILTWNVSTLCMEPPTPQNITTKNTTTKSTENIQQCPSTFTLASDQQLVAKGEQLHYTFQFDTIPETYEITYWIEDARNNIIKKKHTTNNVDEKTYTIANKLEEGTYIHIFGKAKTTCGSYTAEKIIGIEHKTTTEKIYFELEEKDNNAEIYFEIQNAQEKKYTIHIETIEGKEVSKFLVLDLLEGEDVKIITTLPLLYTEEYLKGILFGTEKIQESYFKTTYKPKEKEQKLILHHTYTRQKKLTPIINWYVRSEGTPPYTITITYNTNKTIRKNISTNKTITTTFMLKNISSNATIYTSLENKDATLTNKTTQQFTVEQTFAKTITEEKEKREQKTINFTANQITGKITASHTTPSKKTTLGSLLLASILILGVFEIRKRKQRLIKEGNFIKQEESRTTTLPGEDIHEEKRNSNIY